VRIARLEADARRTPHQLALSHLLAQMDGLSLNGDLTLAEDQPGHPGQFTAAGRAQVKDLHSLRAALPQAAVWKWVPDLPPGASGSLQFKLGGPVADPSQLHVDGTFDARNFRLGSPLPNGGS
jgi:hypothetical protein